MTMPPMIAGRRWCERISSNFAVSGELFDSVLAALKPKGIALEASVKVRANWRRETCMDQQARSGCNDADDLRRGEVAQGNEEGVCFLEGIFALRGLIEEPV